MSDEPMTALLVPEILLPAQALDERAFPTGAHRLALAILVDAIQIYRMECAGRRNLRLRREAALWLNSDDRSWCFSFKRICEALELDADRIRRGLHAPRACSLPQYRHAGRARRYQPSTARMKTPGGGG
jgi:hypothetical protein